MAERILTEKERYKFGVITQVINKEIKPGQAATIDYSELEYMDDQEKIIAYLSSFYSACVVYLNLHILLFVK